MCLNILHGGTPPPLPSDSRGILSVAAQQVADLTFKKSEAEACLSQGLFEEAIPGAQEALQLSIDLYGKESIDVVPCYLLLAEANLGGTTAKLAWPNVQLPFRLSHRSTENARAVVTLASMVARSR